MQEKYSYQGRVCQLKLIPTQQNPLVHVKLALSNRETINALIGRKALSFLLDVQEGDQVAIFGHYNHKQQFIIEKYLNAKSHSNQRPDLPSHLHYPHRKED